MVRTVLQYLVITLTVLFDRGAPTTPKRPNIVVLLADDLGIGDIGCYGNVTMATPHIDGLAAEGARLTQFLTAAAVCTPSRAAFLTGRYPIRSGMTGNNWNIVSVVTASTSALPTSEVTFAEIAKEGGYRTGIIGKWHQGLHQGIVGDNVNNPLNQGFDYWFGLPLTNIKDFDDEETPVMLVAYPHAHRVALVASALGVLAFLVLYRRHYIGTFFLVVLVFLAVFIPHYPLWVATHLKFLNSMFYRNFELVEQPINFEGLTKRLVKEGVDFMRASKNEETPFLLYMSWLQPHTVLHAGPEFQGKSQHGRYGDEIMEMDWSVGEILGALDDLGIREDTFVLFTSDHGGHVEERGKDGDVQGGHNGIYRGGKFQGGMDGGIRVPTVVRWPGNIPPGLEINVPLSNMDFLPTVADLVGQDVPGDRVVDGRSLLPLLLGQTDRSQHDFLMHYCTDTIHAVRVIPTTGGTVWKVRYATPTWTPGTEGCGFVCFCDKATWHDDPLVFDMTSNPTEDEPLGGRDPRYRDVIDAARDAVVRHQESVVPVTDQMSMWNGLFKPHLMPCCNFPYCSCRDPKHVCL